MTIKHIILSGGAYKGLYELGVLKYLSEKEFYNIEEIESIHGTSIGGFIGVLLCLKMDWNTIYSYIIHRPWYKITNVSPMMLFDVLPKKGILGYDFFKEAMKPLLDSKHYDLDITLYEFYEKTEIELNLYAIEMNTFDLKQISYKSHPELKLIEAIHMTCCLPFIFQPVWYETSYYIDGGLINNYPIDTCLNNKDIKEKEILGLKFDISDSCPELQKESNIFEYGYFLYKKIVRTNNNKNDIYHNKKDNIYELVIPCKNIDANDGYDTIINSECRSKYIYDGENFAKVFYNYIERTNNLPKL